MLCNICKKEISVFGSKSFSGEYAECLSCFSEKKKQEQKIIIEKKKQFEQSKRVKKTFITDGGMIFEKDSSGAFYHDGEKVSASELQETLKSHGRVYEATRPDIRRFVETQEYAYNNRKR